MSITITKTDYNFLVFTYLTRLKPIYYYKKFFSFFKNETPKEQHQIDNLYNIIIKTNDYYFSDWYDEDATLLLKYIRFISYIHNVRYKDFNGNYFEVKYFPEQYEIIHEKVLKGEMTENDYLFSINATYSGIKMFKKFEILKYSQMTAHFTETNQEIIISFE